MNRRSDELVDSEGRPVAVRRRRVLPIVLGLILLLVVAAIVIAVVIAGKDTKGAKQDVTVRACNADPGGGKPTASGVILNHSSKTSNYVVKLKFTDAQGNTLSEGAAPVKSVDSKRTASWELTGDRSAKGPVKCVLTGVSRTHLPGQ
jgi:hypothetical protein